MPDTLITRLVRGVDRLFLACAAAGLLAMMLHICADILGSLLLNRPIAVTSAFVTQYYMIAVAFLPFFATELRGSHISITLFTDLLPRRAQTGLALLVQALSAGVAGMLTLQAWDQATDKYAIGAYMVEQTSRILVWPSFFIVPLGLGALTLLMALKVVLALLGQPLPRAEPTGGDNV